MNHSVQPANLRILRELMDAIEDQGLAVPESIHLFPAGKHYRRVHVMLWTPTHSAADLAAWAAWAEGGPYEAYVSEDSATRSIVRTTSTTGIWQNGWEVKVTLFERIYGGAGGVA